MMRMLLVLVLLLLACATPSIASDGVLEINQTCAVQTGCFAGDTAAFPVTIDGSAGLSYRLTSDLSVPNENTDAIVLSASDIGIDLNQFAILGPVTCTGSPLLCTSASGTGSGVEVSSTTNRGISVKNGRVTGMGSYGVFLGEQAEVANLHTRWNRVHGIFVGLNSMVSGSAAYQNGFAGILAANSSAVSGSSALENGSDGINVGIGSTVSNNSASQNGEDGIDADGGSTVANNSASSNGGDGIEAGSGSAIIGNTAFSNGDATTPATDDGIQCFSGCSVRGNTAGANSGFGLNLGTESAYSDNVVTENTTGTVTGLGSTNGRGGNLCGGTGTVSVNCP